MKSRRVTKRTSRVSSKTPSAPVTPTTPVAHVEHVVPKTVKQARESVPVVAKTPVTTTQKQDRPKTLRELIMESKKDTIIPLGKDSVISEMMSSKQTTSEPKKITEEELRQMVQKMERMVYLVKMERMVYPVKMERMVYPVKMERMVKRETMEVEDPRVPKVNQVDRVYLEHVVHPVVDQVNQ